MTPETLWKLREIRAGIAERRRARILWWAAALVTIGTAAGLVWLVARAWGL